jgi:mRNA-degrading endonuclease HigB of HigAB toxin-antitoxin module
MVHALLYFCAMLADVMKYLNDRLTSEIGGYFLQQISVIPFYLQSVLVHSVNSVKNVYSGMQKNAQ